MENKLKRIIKRGTQLLWLYGGIVIFFIYSILVVVSQMLELGIVGIIISTIAMVFFIIWGIINKFGASNEVFRIYEDSIIYIKKHEGEKKYLWKELTYKKERIHYIIYRHTHVMKTKYSFFKDGKLLFVIDDKEDFNTLKFVEEKLIKTGILKEEKTIIDGEEVLEVKPNKSILIDMFALIITSIFLLVFAIVGASLGKKGDYGFTLFIYIISLPFQIMYFKREFIQFKQRVYVVKDKGFYTLREGKKTFYKFNEIDKAEVEYYMSYADIECAMTIRNKSNEEIIVLTNSNVGFYEFLDVLKEINKVK